MLALRLVEPEPRYVVAVAGILTGAAMTAATSSGRHFVLGLQRTGGEVEAWLALGATTRLAHHESPG